MSLSPQQIADNESRLDRFAELLSLDIPISTISQRLGIARGAGYKLLARLRKRLGVEQCR